MNCHNNTTAAFKPAPQDAGVLVRPLNAKDAKRLQAHLSKLSPSARAQCLVSFVPSFVPRR